MTEAKGESLADLAPGSDDLGQPIQVPVADAQTDMDAETLAVLGARLAADGFAVPPVTAGTLALLDLIDSPFVTGADPDVMDVLATLYVLSQGPAAVRPVFAA